MKFTRNVCIMKGSFEAAPWAAVMFLLVIFLMLGALLYTPGVYIELPLAGTLNDNLPGTDKPTITVALDANGRLYFENQLIEEPRLRKRLMEVAKASPEPPTLIVQADKAVSYERLIQLTQLARAAGIDHALFATLPGPIAKAAAVPPKP